MRYDIIWNGEQHGYSVLIYTENHVDLYYLGRDAIDIIRLRAIEYMKGLNNV